MKTWLLAYFIGSPSWIRTMISNRLEGTITIKCFYVNRRSSKAKNLLETTLFADLAWTNHLDF